MCEDTSGLKQMNLTPKNESTKLWRNSLVMLGLLIAHIIINHRLVFLGRSHHFVNAVGTDPCDAVNLFAGISILFIVIGSLLTISSGQHSSSPLRYLSTVRSQVAVLFAIFVTFMAEIIALARNLTMWTRVVSPIRLFALLGALTAVTVATQLLILFTQRNRISLSSLRWTRTVLPVMVAIVVLAVCPEWPIYNSSTTAHFLTVVLGALVVFIPMRLFLPEVVLNRSDAHRETTTFGTAREWTSLVGGVVVVLFRYWLHLPIVIERIAELFIAYAVLGAPLGFAGSPKNLMQDARADK
jgi:hypothetical protein